MFSIERLVSLNMVADPAKSPPRCNITWGSFKDYARVWAGLNGTSIRTANQERKLLRIQATRQTVTAIEVSKINALSVCSESPCPMGIFREERTFLMQMSVVAISQVPQELDHPDG
jgi:hypothetical protein